MSSHGEDRQAFLKKMQLFRGFDEQQLIEVADRLDSMKLEKDELLFSEGDFGDNFYIIQSGLVKVWLEEDQEEVELAVLEAGDYFGEEALLSYQTRTASITALEETSLLFIDEQDFEWLVQNFPQTKVNLDAIAATHRMAREQRFEWLGDGEVIHLILQRHPAHFWYNLLKPAALIVPGAILFYFIIIAPTPATQLFASISSGILLIASILWGIWYFIDWRNDYFIVTNRRVLWLEKVLFLNASRNEAPLSTIQSVNVRTSLIGRILDFGTLNVRTYTGSLEMTNVKTPELLQGFIEELLLRVRNKTKDAKLETIRYTIRKNLGYDVEGEEAGHPPEPIAPEVEEAGILQRIFKSREVDEDIFTYHKHWFSLLKSTWLPNLILIFVLLGMLWLVWRNWSTGAYPTISTIMLVGFLILLFPTLSLIYQFLDWRNDLYRVTKDQIIDREKKPFSTETINSAPLKNVLSLKFEKEGILGMLLNFGHVEINVGDASLTFDDIHNPALVQQDIFYSMEMLKQTVEHGEEEQEKDRMMNWLRTYHEIQESEGNSDQV